MEEAIRRSGRRASQEKGHLKQWPWGMNVVGIVKKQSQNDHCSWNVCTQDIFHSECTGKPWRVWAGSTMMWCISSMLLFSSLINNTTIPQLATKKTSKSSSATPCSCHVQLSGFAVSISPVTPWNGPSSSAHYHCLGSCPRISHLDHCNCLPNESYASNPDIMLTRVIFLKYRIQKLND